MRKSITKLLIIAVILVSCIGVFAACNKKGDDVNELTLWAGGQWTGTDLQNLKSFIEEYNKSNDIGVTVKVVAKSDMESALSTAVRNNKVPDILIWDRFNTPTYSKVDALMDISEYITRDNVDLSLFNDAAMSELYYDDKYYGLPLDLDVWGLYINTDMVDDYNAENPSSPIVLNDNWTWDDLYDIARKLTVYQGGQMKVAGYSGHVMHQHYFKYLCSTDETFLTASGQPNFNTQEARDILTFFQKIGSRNSGIWENGLVEKSNFTSGQLAIIDQSLYFTDYIERYNANMNYKFMPQPRYSVNGVVQTGAVNGGMLGGFGIAFPKPAEKFRTDDFYAKFEKAWEFAKDWLLDEEIQSNWSETTGTLPALKSLCSPEKLQSNTILSRAATFLPNYKIRPQIPSYLTMQTQVIDNHIKAFTEGTASLEDTINSLNNGCREYMR